MVAANANANATVTSMEKSNNEEPKNTSFTAGGNKRKTREGRRFTGRSFAVVFIPVILLACYRLATDTRMLSHYRISKSSSFWQESAATATDNISARQSDQLELSSSPATADLSQKEEEDVDKTGGDKLNVTKPSSLINHMPNATSRTSVTPSSATAIVTPESKAVTSNTTTLPPQPPQPSVIVNEDDGNNNKNIDIIVWISGSHDFNGEGLVISEFDQEQKLDYAVNYELRPCIIINTTTDFDNTSTPDGDNSTTNMTLPECPIMQKSNNNNNKNITIIDRTTELLRFCYDPNLQQRRLKEKHIVAITLPTSTATTNNNPTTFFIKYKDFQRIDNHNCPKHCPQPTIASSTNNNNKFIHKDKNVYPYKFDMIDKICKSTLPNAMPPKRIYGGSCSCVSTCHTPIAVAHNSTWPFQNQSEKDFFNALPMTQLYERRNQKWKGMRFQQRYEMRFQCKEDKKMNNKTNITTATTTKDQQDLLLPPEAFGAFEHHLFYIPKAKLIFCGVPKAGITEWIKFLRFVMGANDYLSIPHWKNDREHFMMSWLTVDKAKELLLDPSWTKAMFFRDPAERLLSAYFDKIVKFGMGDSYLGVNNGTEGYFKERKDKTSRYVMSFREFVDTISVNNTDMDDRHGLHGTNDPHWRPQSMLCGMDYLLPHLDFIGNLEHVAEHTKLLLEKVGIWDDYGAKFDPADDLHVGKGYCSYPPPPRPANYTPVGFNQKGPTSTTGHRTGSKTKMEEYYTPELLEKVRKAYVHDYAIWDDLTGRPADDVLSGSDLSVVKAHCNA